MNLHALPLPGLRDDNPRDFLAALGLLRLVDLLWPDRAVRLGWQALSRVPVLSFRDPLPANWCAELIAALQSLAKIPDPPFIHGEIIKVEHAVFRQGVERAVEFAATEHPLARLPLLLYAAYSSQIAGDGGLVEPSGFSFANGQSGKKLLLDVSQLIAAMDADSFSETLAGTAQPVAAKSLRWNPSEFRPAAYRSHDPGSKLKGDEGRDHPALNVLAFCGLTFYSTVPVLSGGGATIGMHRAKGETHFLWPIWSHPLRPDEIGSLVCASPEAWTPATETIAVWKSKRFSSDKSLYFAPPESVR